MADSDAKTAAATLACEASRQQLAASTSKGPRDIPGELMQLYSWFVEQIGNDKVASAKPGAAPKSW